VCSSVDAQCRTSLPDVWAGQDRVAVGQDLTVVAAQDGKRAPSIDQHARAPKATGAKTNG
jgi:glutamate synthase (NADPH/NADH) small chain